MNILQYKKTLLTTLIGIIIAMTVFDGYYITKEGNITVIQRAGKVIGQSEAGFHFKIPFLDSITHIDIKARKSVESLEVSTSEQMKADGVVSINWRVVKGDVKDLYSNYGSLDKFEDIVLNNKLRESAKIAIARYTAEQNLVSRDEVSATLRDVFLQRVQGLPITDITVQIEDIKFSAKYLESIDKKQTEKNLVEAERYTLERQNLNAQQATNTANAEAEATRVRKKAEADGIELVGTAEANAIKQKAQALKDNPLIIDLTLAQQWDGKYPTTMMGNGTGILMDMRQNLKDK